MRALTILGAIVALAGCASTSPKNAFDDVAANVKQRSGHDVHWDQGKEDSDDKAADRALDRLLSKELSADTAVQIALVANAGLKAKLEELSIAQADLVQAGLLENPTFTIGRTAWESEHIDPNIFASVEQNFLSILTMPLKKRVAAAELEATKLEIGDDVLELAAQVRMAFYEAQAAEQIVAMRRLVDDASKTSSEIARRQAEAGNMNDLNLSMTLASSAQTSLDRKRAEGEAAVAREKLNKLMGLWGPRTSWKLGGKLPDIPAADPPLEHLEGTAIEHRLDVAAAQRNVQAMRYALSLASTTRWVGTVNVHVEAGRLRHNKRFSFGPSVALEIPLFDQRQAQIAKLEAHVRQSEAELRALAVDVRSDVRAARARVVTARGVALEYAKVVVPQRESVVRYSQEQYDAMLLGVYQLIQAKQAEYEAYREYIEAVRDYWIARSDLERAVGTRLGGVK